MTLGKCIQKSAFGRYKNNMKTVNAVFMDTKCTQNMAQSRHVARSENLGRTANSSDLSGASFSTLLLFEGIPRALKGKKLHQKNLLLFPSGYNGKSF